MVFYIPFTCITLYLFQRSPLLRYAIKITNNGMREKKIFCMYNYFHVSRYIKGGRKSHYVHNRIFRHTCVYKQTILTKYRLGSTTGSRKKVNIQRPLLVFLIKYLRPFKKNLGGHSRTVEISDYPRFSPIGVPKN